MLIHSVHTARDEMFGLGFSEMVMIMFVALLAIGPKRLPGVAKALGRGYAEFRSAMDEMRSTVYREINAPLAEVKKPLQETSAEYLDKLLKEREEARAREAAAAVVYDGAGEQKAEGEFAEGDVGPNGEAGSLPAGEGSKETGEDGKEKPNEPGGSPAGS